MCGAELSALPESVQKVARVLQERGHAHMPVMLSESARTAQHAIGAAGNGRGVGRGTGAHVDAPDGPFTVPLTA